ncbi:hypothetical protein T01_1895 [Trichinella spiralis]|uniref:Uncharacterized protein n=1 Tax=Trichinella spiralis TaxID=6334 RepID=A0A0V1BNF4_TRISP|nr:hypothetical protein T01_7163 [Trichinella spiralis]KRY38522.1 hypothetical protein T01_1895 [Trichinella spiralis]
METLRQERFQLFLTVFEMPIFSKSYYLFNYFDVHSEFIPSTNCCIKSPSPARELKDSTK